MSSVSLKLTFLHHAIPGNITTGPEWKVKESKFNYATISTCRQLQSTRQIHQYVRMHGSNNENNANITRVQLVRHLVYKQRDRQTDRQTQIPANICNN